MVAVIIDNFNRGLILKTFKVQWASGRVEFLKGIDIATALVDARHSKSAIRAIKKYEEVSVMSKRIHKENKVDDRWCSDFKEFLAEEVVVSSSFSKRPTGKDKRAQRIANKRRDKVSVY